MLCRRGIVAGSVRLQPEGVSRVPPFRDPWSVDYYQLCCEEFQHVLSHWEFDWISLQLPDSVRPCSQKYDNNFKKKDTKDDIGKLNLFSSLLSWGIILWYSHRTLNNSTLVFTINTCYSVLSGYYPYSSLSVFMSCSHFLVRHFTKVIIYSWCKKRSNASSSSSFISLHTTLEQVSTERFQSRRLWTSLPVPGKIFPRRPRFPHPAYLPGLAGACNLIFFPDSTRILHRTEKSRKKCLYEGAAYPNNYIVTLFTRLSNY